MHSTFKIIVNQNKTLAVIFLGGALLGLLIGYFHLEILLVILLVAMAAIIAIITFLFRPRYGWIAFGIMIPIGFVVRIPIGSFQIAPSMLVLLIMLPYILIFKHRIPNSSKLTLGALILLLLYPLVEIFDSIRSVYPLWSLDLGIKIIFGLIIYISFVKILPDGYLEIFSNSLIFSTVIFLAFAVVYYIFVLRVAYISSTLRLDTGHAGRNELALLFPLVTPIAFSRLMIQKNSNIKSKILNWITIIVLLTATALTLSRGAYLSTILAFFWVLFWSRRSLLIFWKILPYAILILVVFLGLARFMGPQISDTVLGRFVSIAEVFNIDVNSRGASTGQSVEVRKDLLRQAIVTWEENPIFGIGTGNFQILSNVQNILGRELPTHNEYLRWIVEHGIIGFIALALLPIIHLLGMVRVINKPSKSNYPYWFLVGVGGSVVTMLFQLLLINVNSHYFYWIALGAAGNILFHKNIKTAIL